MRSNRRIVWTHGEREDIITKAVEICRQHAKMPIFHAVGQAQDLLLPLNRRRKWITKTALGDMVSVIEKELNKPVHPIHVTVTAEPKAELEEAVIRADQQVENVRDFDQQCILWRGLVTGYLMGRQK